MKRKQRGYKKFQNGTPPSNNFTAKLGLGQIGTLDLLPTSLAKKWDGAKERGLTTNQKDRSQTHNNGAYHNCRYLKGFGFSPMKYNCTFPTPKE